MAEAVAGAIVAEQIVSTGVEVGAVAAVARPTQPLKATPQQIASISAGDTSLSLARSHHTVTVVGNKAYLFGGKNPDGQLCSADIHALSLEPETASEGPPYACYPPLADEDGPAGDTLAPSPRSGHAAAARGSFIVVYGGADAEGRAIDEGGSLWLWNSETIGWTRIKPTLTLGTPPPVYGHHIFVDEKQDVLYLHGGADTPTGETWKFDFKAGTWSQLPASPEPPAAAAFVDGVLYSLGVEAAITGTVHFLRIEEADGKPSWTHISYPINPLVPGPSARVGGALLPVGTGLGRKYLVYLPGRHKDRTTAQEPAAEAAAHEPAHSNIWALQIFSEPYSAASVKDVVRDNLPGSDSGLFDWGEVEIVAAEQMGQEGKAHPGPRGWFGADACIAGKGVVLWGGINGKGEAESDGWVIRFE